MAAAILFILKMKTREPRRRKIACPMGNLVMMPAATAAVKTAAMPATTAPTPAKSK
jgi:hypothetical protein